MKGKNARLHNATRAELWQRFQRPLNDLQLWKALAQRLLDITASLPDLASVHTFLPQIEVTRLRGAGEATGPVSGISATLPGTNTFLGPQDTQTSQVPSTQEGLSLVLRDKSHP